MCSHYIIRLPDDKLFAFYHEKNRGILYQTYIQNQWGKPITLVENGRKKFTVNMSNQGELYVFCQNMEGHVLLCLYQNEGWTTRTILENQSKTIHTILFNAMIQNGGMSLLYNVPAPEEKFQYLVRQQVDPQGKWSEAIRIDKMVDTSGSLYSVQTITPDHLLLFYQTRDPEYHLGYREITPDKLGNFNSFHTTSYLVTDKSCLATNQAIHVCYIVKSMFSSQLIYRKKEDGPFNNPIVLWEGQNLENCLLFYTNGHLQIFFLHNKILYSIVSQDNGNSFTRPGKYRNKICQNPVKAAYLAMDQHEQTLFAREVYVDGLNPCDIQLLPDLYGSFYPRFVEEAKPVAETRQIETQPDQTLDRMENALAMQQKQLNEKDMQIQRLTELLRTRNETLTTLELERKKLIKTHQDEIQLLNEKRVELENKINALINHPTNPEKPVVQTNSERANEAPISPHGNRDIVE